jgi:hypothetical protein
MRSLATTLAVLASALLLVPTVASAQDIIEPPLPPPCDVGCWWPTTTVAQLDGIEADLEVTDGKSVARYRFDLSNPADPGMGGPGAEGRIVFPVPAGSS